MKRNSKTRSSIWIQCLMTLSLLSPACENHKHTDNSDSHEHNLQGHEHETQARQHQDQERTFDVHAHATQDHEPDHGAHADDIQAMQGSGEKTAPDPGQDDQKVHLDENTINQLGVQIAQVWPEPYAPSVKIPGEVRVDPDRRVSVSTPVAGRILSLDVPPNANVKTGQRLAVIELVDSDVRHQQIRAVEIRADLVAAQTELDRTQAYLEALNTNPKSVQAEKRRVAADLAVAQAKARSHKSSLDAVLASLRLAGLSQSQLSALEQSGKVTTRISLYAPDLGRKANMEVVSRPVHLGQTVAHGTQLYELVALDRLRVVGEAFESDLPYVRQATRDRLSVSLFYPATGRKVHDLKIYSVEGTLDDPARVIHFFMWLPNHVVTRSKQGRFVYSDWEYRAGERVQILVPTSKTQNRFVLPVDALVKKGGHYWLFKQCADGCDRVRVKVESIDDRMAIIGMGQGLRAGESVVVSGALQIYLSIEQAANPKENQDHGHGHHHNH